MFGFKWNKKFRMIYKGHMDLPSVSINNGLKTRSMSTIRARNQKWFDEYYISRSSDVIEEKKGRVMEVGKMYSFMYEPKHKDKLMFYDFMPMMLCIGHIKTKKGNINAMGINLSYLPPQTRIKVLDKIVKMFDSNVIDSNVKLIKQKRFGTLKELPLFYDVCKQILEKSGFEFAIRSYIYTHIRKEPRIITYEDWWRPATFPSKFIEEKNILAIYALQKQSLDPSFRIGKKNPKVSIVENKVRDLKNYLKKR